MDTPAKSGCVECSIEATLDLWCMTIAGIMPTMDTTVLDRTPRERIVKTKTLDGEAKSIVFEMHHVRKRGKPDALNMTATAYGAPQNILRHVDRMDNYHVIQGNYLLEDVHVIDERKNDFPSITLGLPDIQANQLTFIRNLCEQLMRDVLEG
jgi:hypothetical protein